MQSKIGVGKNINTMNCNKRVSAEPLRLFISGGAGVGKSHLMNTISMFLTKTMNPYSESRDPYDSSREAQGPYSCPNWSSSH